MTTITEIAQAISHLPPSQVEELASWLEQYRKGQASPTLVDAWLKRAVGAAKPGATTDDIMSLMRDNE